MKAKDNLGLVKTISVTYDMEIGKPYDKEKSRMIRKALKPYQMDIKNEIEGPGVKLVEYNANYLVADWDKVMENLEELLPFAELKLLEGNYNQETDDFQYDYETLHILV